MNKAKDQHLPSYTHAPTAKTTRWNKRFWVLATLAGMLVFAMNFRGVLEAASWKPHTGCRKSQKPRSHYTLPSGDQIPSVALGEFPLRSRLLLRSLTDSSSLFYPPGVWQANGGEAGQAVKAALAAGYRHIDDAWAYHVRTLTLPSGINQSKHLHTE